MLIFIVTIVAISEIMARGSLLLSSSFLTSPLPLTFPLDHHGDLQARNDRRNHRQHHHRCHHLDHHRNHHIIIIIILDQISAILLLPERKGFQKRYRCFTMVIIVVTPSISQDIKTMFGICCNIVVSFSSSFCISVSLCVYASIFL